MKKLYRPGRKAAGTTVDGHAFPGAIRIRARFWQLFESSAEVIGHKEINTPVAVVVDPGAARAIANSTLGEPGFDAYIGESAIAIVVVQHVVAVGGDEKVVKAVVVIISDSHA